MIRLLVFDMAGTTVRDQDEVLVCFRDACRQSGLNAPDERLNALMGVSKLEVFKILWAEDPETAPESVEALAQKSYGLFRAILEAYYFEKPVLPTEGALEAFAWCRQHSIKIALNTGFYRRITDIILDRLGWQIGQTVDFVVSSDEVAEGRPAPYMIQAAMRALGVLDTREVVKIGDTPVDLAEGRNAGCLLSLGVVNGTHSREQLSALPNDGLLGSLAELPAFLTPYL